jgi:hypothetical protein
VHQLEQDAATLSSTGARYGAEEARAACNPVSHAAGSAGGQGPTLCCWVEGRAGSGLLWLLRFMWQRRIPAQLWLHLLLQLKGSGRQLLVPAHAHCSEPRALLTRLRTLASVGRTTCC